MIRKTLNNDIEEFNVDGGEVIDEFGAWAYQIPMNLDYMITNEYGDLILTQDDTKGIPTRSRVRFNIGMNDDGSNGRLRTRARYLVPNNPKSGADTDYEFGRKTKDHSFRDIYWNKIYTVSNFIPRFQRNNSFTPNLTRNATGIKDVEDAGGNKVLFPYNRVTTEFNPLFFILCLILTIVVLIVKLINSTIIFLINLLIELLNRARKVRIPVIRVTITLWRKINYIPCIKLPCDDKFFAPGCSRGGLAAAQPVYSTEGFLECILFQIAKALNLFQFDFYNDWINGSLYSYLLKYKRRRKKERFCELNCDDLAGGGSDGNGNGRPDNSCYNSLLSDTCYRAGNDSQKSFRPVGLREGLIKKVGQEFFYAATNKSSGYKMFATELINLGSVFDCDWQGIPKLQPYLITTTYKTPPDTVEPADDGRTTELAGQCDIEGNTCGMFFTIDCKGLHSDSKQCINVRHQCEFGVDLHGLVLGTQNEILRSGDKCSLAKSWEFDDNTGFWFRDVFWYLNKSNTPWIGPNSFSSFYPLTTPPNSIDTSFNTLDNDNQYDFIAIGPNGKEYYEFRGYELNHSAIPSDSGGFSQPEHSYFFYFGLINGSSGLDKMNKKFFAPCTKKVRDSILISSTSTQTDTNTGTITFSIIGGVGPYTYTITSVNDLDGVPFNITPITGNIATSNTPVGPIGGLIPGTYNINVIDAVGTPVNDLVTVNGPLNLYCIAYVSSGATSGDTGLLNGAITISEAGGGTGDLSYVVRTGTGAIISGPSPLITPLNISVPVSGTIGYVVEVFDSAVPPNQCITSGLTISGPSQINVSYTTTNEHCWGSETGAINVDITGGKIPYEVKIVGPNDVELNNILGYTGFTGTIPDGPFTITVVDDTGVTVTVTTPVIGFDVGQMIMTPSPDAGLQCNPNLYRIPFFISDANSAPVIVGQPVIIQYAIDNQYVDADSTNWTETTLTYLGPTIPMYLEIPSTTTVSSSPPFTSTSAINALIAIRYKSHNLGSGPGEPCYSEEIIYEAPQIRLPPVLLQITGDIANTSTTPVIPAAFNNAIQPSTTTGQYKFDITYNMVGFSRAPYTLIYTVNNGSPQTVTPIYDMPYTLYIPNISGTNTLKMKILDNKSCVSPEITRTITLPTTVLTGQIVTTGSMGNYNHRITASGGIGQRRYNSPTGPIIPLGPTGLVVNDAVSVLFTTIYDDGGNSIEIYG
jgi:hypothetical protein